MRPRRRHRGRRGRLLALVALGLLAAWSIGFVVFLLDTDHTAPLPPHADGIVALTGGADRVETALHLLAEGRADWLLVSGIGGGAELSALARRSGVDAAPLAAQVRLGRQATSTRGNAAETAIWVRDKGIRSLIVVTGWYHMPRALAELHRAVPAVRLYPSPVDPDAARLPLLAMTRLLAEEYTKYLAARLDLTALLPEREPAAVRSAHPG